MYVMLPCASIIRFSYILPNGADSKIPDCFFEMSVLRFCPHSSWIEAVDKFWLELLLI